MRTPSDEVVDRHKELCSLIEIANYQYFEKNDPHLSDVEYDAFFRELQGIEKKYPNLCSAQ